MKFWVLPALAVSCLTASINGQDTAAQLNTLLNDAANKVLEQLATDEAILSKRGLRPSCTIKTIAIRQEL